MSPAFWVPEPTTLHSVLGEMQKVYVSAQAGKYDKDLVQFRFANRHRRVRILFTEYAVAGVWVYLSDDLAMMLGFKSKRRYWYRNANVHGEIFAERPVLLITGTSNVFVYCDLLEHIKVGDVKAPLLRIVNRKTAVSRFDDRVEHTAFNPVQQH